MKKVIRLPKELEPHKDLLKATATSFVQLVAHNAGPDRVWNSKIGGFPYMKVASDYPVDGAGKPMFLLAQINFSEFGNIKGFPTKGLLQFFMEENGMYGNDNEKTITVNYIADPTVEMEVKKNQAEVEYENLPLNNTTTDFVLSATKSVEIAPLSDIAFDGKLGDEFFRAFGEDEYDLRDRYSEAVAATGHKIGGYAHFAQEDPRAPDHDDILLLQLDSDDKIGLKWGDMGVAHFFIKKADLENLDFSRVIFQWDCH